MTGFNTQFVSKITGLSKRQIDYWDRTHFIKPSIREATGHGSGRLYSFMDLVQLKVARALKDKGISLQKMRKSLNYLKKHKPEVEKPMAELKFLTDGETIFVLTTNKKVVLDTLSKGQLVMTMALGEIVQNLDGQIKALVTEREYTVTVKGQRYTVVVHPDPDDGGFWVECPALLGCASQGDSVQEALGMIKDAIIGHLDILAEGTKPKAEKKRVASAS